MNATQAMTTGFENSFAAASVFLKQPWLKAFCAQQFEKFLQHGLPIKKNEWWKYTDVSYLEKMNFTLPAISATENDKPEKYIDSSILLVFKNGHFSPTLSNLDLLPPEMILSPLSVAVQTYKSLIKPYLLQELDGQRHPFTYLNSAFMVEGVFLQIPRNCALPYPIHLLFLNTGQNHFISCPRNIIIADENSQVKIIEEHTANQAENYFTNVVTELHVGANAQLNYYKLQNEHHTATHIANIRVKQKEDSSVNTFFADYGSRLTREDLTIDLHERGAACHMAGLYLLERDEQHIDNHIYVDHAAAHCSSSILYKGILDKKSQAVFNGKVYAHSTAKQTYAQQVNHNLLLSSTAEVNTKPELEIYADDVKCTHGATVGQLNKEALFYLRARGIEKEEALKILIQAFIEEIMHKITDPFIKDYIWQRAKRVEKYANL
jgi:Fe-S cluster assembly protein SufD